MIKGGLLEEVTRLYEMGYRPREVNAIHRLPSRRDGLAGEMSLDDAVRLMKRDTRRYAKRQFTWFRSEPDIVWCDPQDTEMIVHAIHDFSGSDPISEKFALEKVWRETVR